MRLTNRMPRPRRRPLVATLGLLGLATFATAGAVAEPPPPDSGIVEITDLPPETPPAKIELPAEASPIAEAFVIRRDEQKPSKESPLKPPTWFDPMEEIAAASPPRTVDPAVRPAHRVEPAHPNASRAMALLVVARQMAVEARTMGDFTDVLEQCHRALDADPDRPTAEALARLGAWAHNRRGELLARSNERAAFDDFQEAIQLDPTCWEALHNRGVTLARYQKLEEAVADFTRVLELEPTFHLARFNRAQSYCQLEQWQAAIVDYTAAIKAMPDEPLAYAGRAQAELQLALHREAHNDFNRALAIDGGCEKALVGRAMLHADQGAYRDAADDFRRAMAGGNPSAATYRAVGWFLASCPDPEFRDPAKAIEAARRALAMAGNDDAPSLDLLAAAHAAAGDYAQAFEAQQRALEVAPENEKAEFQARLEQYQQLRSAGERVRR